MSADFVLEYKFLLLQSDQKFGPFVLQASAERVEAEEPVSQSDSAAPADEIPADSAGASYERAVDVLNNSSPPISTESRPDVEEGTSGAPGTEDEENDAKVDTARVALLKEVITKFSFVSCNRGLFDRHKLTVAVFLTLKIMASICFPDGSPSSTLVPACSK